MARLVGEALERAQGLDALEHVDGRRTARHHREGRPLEIVARDRRLDLVTPQVADLGRQRVLPIEQLGRSCDRARRGDALDVEVLATRLRLHQEGPRWERNGIATR